MPTKKRSSAGNPGSGRERTPGEPSDINQSINALKDVARLCRKMSTTPTIKDAQELKFRANQLEELSAGIRRNAHEYLNAAVTEQEALGQRTAVLTALGKTFTGVAPEPEHPESPLEESGKALLGFATPAELLRSAVVGPPRPALAAAPAAGMPGPDDTFDLGDFFRTVSESVISAQQQLDSLSLQYALQQAGSAIPPALYSIPTVKAEVKAGLSKTGGSGIMVKLMHDDTATNFTESTISFDVVASPPPPGRLDRFTSPVPRFLVIEGTDRQNVINAIAQSPGTPPLCDGWLDRAVVIRDLDPSRASPGQQAFFALVPGPPPAPDAGGNVDFSGVSLGVFLYEEGNPIQPIASPAGAFTALLVRSAFSIGLWLKSVIRQ